MFCVVVIFCILVFVLCDYDKKFLYGIGLLLRGGFGGGNFGFGDFGIGGGNFGFDGFSGGNFGFGNVGGF